MGLAKKVFVAVVIAVAVLLASNFANDAYYKYAVIEYSLSADSIVRAGESVQISLHVHNSGSANAVPNFDLQVKNATIQKISLPSITESEVGRFSNYDTSMAKIGNFTAMEGQGDSVWATVTIIPNEGVSAFSIKSSATLPFDVQHPKSTTMTNSPYELYYQMTNTGDYVQTFS